MTRPYSEAFKQKMVQRLIGKDAVSATELARETGVRQQNLSRWLANARSLPVVTSGRPKQRTWTVAEKARVIAEAASLEGDKLTSFLEREGVKLAELERWRLALDDRETSTAMAKRVRSLERELARKEKALAEAAALLVLKKKVEDLYREDEDDDTDKGNDR